MADGDSAPDEAVEEKKKGGGPKKLVLPIVILVVGLFAGKTFFAGGESAEALAAKEKEERIALEKECAVANGLPPVSPTEQAAQKASAEAAAAGGAEAGAEAEADGTAEVEAPDLSGPVLTLDAKTLNLRDGHYLKIGIALQAEAGADVKVLEEENRGSMALDMANEAFSSKTMEELLPQEARETIKQQLGNELCLAYQGEILTLYYTDFVMQ